MTPSFPDLERRFFQKDVSWAERERILDAALGLREGQGTFSPGRSALGRFIDTARVVLCRPDLIDPPLVGDGTELPLALRVPIASMILQRMPITHEWLFSWWSCGRRNEGGFSGLAREDEFRMFFALCFARRFPRGLPLSAGGTPGLAPRYRAASGAFEASVDLTPYGGPLCDISTLREPLTIAEEIAVEVARDLEPWSVLLDRSPESMGSAEAHALLPKELRPFFPSRAAEDFIRWARGSVAAGGRVMLEELSLRIRGVRPGQGEGADPAALREMLPRLGFGLAPDSRVSLRLLRAQEPVVLFATEEEAPRPPGRALRAELERLTLAATLGGMAEMTTAERGLRVIAEEGRAGLSGWERDLFDATRDWLSMVELDIGPVRALLRDGLEAEEKVRELIATILGAGQAAAEVARELGLAPVAPSVEEANAPPAGQELPLSAEPEPIPPVSPEPLPSDETGTGPSLEKDTEEKSTQGSGLPGPGTAGGFWINPAELEQKRRETEKARKALEDVLGKTFAPVPPPATDPMTRRDVASPLSASPPPPASAAASPAGPPPTAASGRFRGLDASTARLAAEMIKWGRWEELEFEALARRHRVMPDGIVEILNEWSIERFHEPIVEVYEGYVLSPSVIAKLNTET